MISDFTAILIQAAPMVSRAMNAIPAAKYRVECVRKFIWLVLGCGYLFSKITFKNNAYIGSTKLNLDIL
jgi:hypothetical protein